MINLKFITIFYFLQIPAANSQSKLFKNCFFNLVKILQSMKNMIFAVGSNHRIISYLFALNIKQINQAIQFIKRHNIVFDSKASFVLYFNFEKLIFKVNFIAKRRYASSHTSFSISARFFGI